VPTAHVLVADPLACGIGFVELGKALFFQTGRKLAFSGAAFPGRAWDVGRFLGSPSNLSGDTGLFRKTYGIEHAFVSPGGSTLPKAWRAAPEFRVVLLRCDGAFHPNWCWWERRPLRKSRRRQESGRLGFLFRAITSGTSLAACEAVTQALPYESPSTPASKA